METMSSTLKNIMIGEELLSAVRLLKTGLRELNRIDGSNDFFDLPILLLSSGFERMMKTILCCYHLENFGEYPAREFFPKGRQGHDLVHLLNQITCDCFSDKYLLQTPSAKTDILFLRKDAKINTQVRILSDFGQSARYYNLNVVLGVSDPGSSPNEEWKKLEMEILLDDPDLAARIQEPMQMKAIHRHINFVLTVNCEKLARALARLFTIGGLGSQAMKISHFVHHFLLLTDGQLGDTDYESIHI